MLLNLFFWVIIDVSAEQTDVKKFDQPVDEIVVLNDN